MVRDYQHQPRVVRSVRPCTNYRALRKQFRETDCIPESQSHEYDGPPVQLLEMFLIPELVNHSLAWYSQRDSDDKRLEDEPDTTRLKKIGHMLRAVQTDGTA